ncbi:MAG: ABC transporter, partial [Candidatus Taylorbacteria bacterium]|nr:ABC transporter [Candidatus Taylorbacteria bacterium]
VMQQKIRSFIREYNTKYNATIILTSHYMDDVKELCKRIIIINQGKLLFDGSLAEIITKHTQLKRISVVFEKVIPRSALGKQGKIISYDGHNAEIEIPKDKASLTTSYLLSHFPVVDLTIEEPQIEEIISTIFSSSSV